MGDNTVQIRVATDLSSVEGAVNKTQQAIQRTIAESLKMQNASAAEAQAIYKELGIAGTQAAMEIQAAFGQTNQEIRKTGAAIPALRWSIQETASGGNSSIRSMFPVLSDLRQVTRAAMGAFAAAYVVEELGRTMAATREAADTWGGFNEAVQKGLADDIKDSDDALIHFRGLTTVLKISTGERLIAQTQLDILRAQAQKQALLDVQTWQKTTAEIVWAYFTMGLTLVPLIKNKIDLNEATAQESELNARLNAQLQDLSALQVRLHTEQAKTAKDREAAADREAHAIARRDADDARFVATTLKANIAGDVQWYQAEDRLLKSIEATNDALEKSRQAAANMDIEAVKVALDMDNWNGAMQRNQQLSRGAAGDQLQEDVTNTRHLSLARKELIGITQDLRLVEDAFKAAMHGEADALQGMTQSVGDVAGQFAQMIGGTKLAAEVKGAFDAALSIEYLAQFIASWGTDTAAGLASVQYGLAAAEMFKVAGGGSRGGSGGGGGSYSSGYGRSGGGSRGGSGSGDSGGGGAAGAGRGTTIHMNIEGVISPDNLAQVMTQMSQLAKGGQATLVATNALTNGAKAT